MKADIQFKEFIVGVEENNKAARSTRMTLAYEVNDTQAKNLFKAIAKLSQGTVQLDVNYIHRSAIRVTEAERERKWNVKRS